MKILVIGRGGREHAIVWKLSKSKHKPLIYVAPGNGGMKEAICVNINELDNEALVDFAKKEQIDLTIVGPDAALMNGIVDAFLDHGLRILGPKLNAAIIEGSKKFTKELMKKYQIPTASYEVFSDYQKALAFVKDKEYPLVIKYDGLAAGKGVIIACSYQEAECSLKDILLNQVFGKGDVVIEEYLEGPEFSLMAFVNHNQVYPMVLAQDHKRAFDNDQGLNTGGMGAYSPVDIITKEEYNYTVKEIMQKVANAMVLESRPFCGILYGGLMKTENGIKVIEFNARFGDPETEVVLPRLNNDLVDVINNLLDGKDLDLSWDSEATLGVVMASNGYPLEYEKGFIIKGLSEDIFHMGTTFKDGNYYTNGGRVLFVLGKGKTLIEAKINAYEKVKKIKCDNLFYRSDIGYQSVK